MERLKQNFLTRNYSHSVKRLYTIPEAAVYLGRSIWSVRELIWRGDLPYIKVGRRVHLDVKDLDAFVDQHKVRAEF
ncbi:helix-turn-helix domain-containing protein [Candidatus Manganitrophus noduliformans]|uniref:Helix-turn-helix domain-containing protein n=1 Tax=Candidatus Manganitrophus noduliformans TaxID=2606439 RepID=A0A7X6DQ27_9BACT|nr:helix-turn-helix domain-containing protein [Candidatus Manganitrophus noduliformans]